MVSYKFTYLSTLFLQTYHAIPADPEYTAKIAANEGKVSGALDTNLQYKGKGVDSNNQKFLDANLEIKTRATGKRHHQEWLSESQCTNILQK